MCIQQSMLYHIQIKPGIFNIHSSYAYDGQKEWVFPFKINSIFNGYDRHTKTKSINSNPG